MEEMKKKIERFFKSDSDTIKIYEYGINIWESNIQKFQPIQNNRVITENKFK